MPSVPVAAAETQPKRIYILGTSGSGKTMLASRLAEQLGLEHTQLDALYWGPAWTESPRANFEVRAQDAAAHESWVIDGAHRAAMPAVWARADCIVWLDYPLRTVLGRIIRRSVRRVIRKEELWHGNLERFRRVVGRRSPILWAVRTHLGIRREIMRRQAADPTRWLIRLRSPREAERWLSAPFASGAPSVATVQGRTMPTSDEETDSASTLALL